MNRLRLRLNGNTKIKVSSSSVGLLIGVWAWNHNHMTNRKAESQIQSIAPPAAVSANYHNWGCALMMKFGLQKETLTLLNNESKPRISDVQKSKSPQCSNPPVANSYQIPKINHSCLNIYLDNVYHIYSVNSLTSINAGLICRNYGRNFRQTVWRIRNEHFYLHQGGVCCVCLFVS